VKKKNALFLGFCIIVFLFFIFFKSSYGWDVRKWLSPQNGTAVDTAGLLSENESLKAQLAELQVVQSELPQAPTGAIRAMVYSRYPMNFRNEILVNAGTNEGVSTGKAVLFGNIFIGEVVSVFPDSALVQTVFDGTFKMPVRVGSAGYDALLTGGASPMAGSILKKAAVKNGDIVTTADPDFPYGIPVGVINSVSISPDNLFEQATVSFAYDMNNVQTVFIAK
jgi:rod shape-determining protein MreC